MHFQVEKSQLWQNTLSETVDALERPRSKLRTSLRSLRERTASLVSGIGFQLPGLTVHDISHLDALWRVAEQVLGPNYQELNPAEAYVFGGAVLLHDSAHVSFAYKDGLDEVKASIEWTDLIAQRYGGQEPVKGSKEELIALFAVLRLLHSEQAHKLASMSWTSPTDRSEVYLIEDAELRNYYADLIGEIAESHHWSPMKVVSRFHDRVVPCPAFLQPANWTVDALKVAFLLRTADAAHIDGDRAPWFLFALQKPEGVSQDHWRFQAKIGQPTLNNQNQLVISSGAPFNIDERQSWWLAFDTAVMIDRELKSAFALMRDYKRTPFSAVGVCGADSPESFARQVRTNGWEPVDVAPKITNVPHVISTLGGASLYGSNNFRAPLRELLQNAIDAIDAYRGLHGLDIDEGHVVVKLERYHDRWLLSVIDTGIGMSRYVMTDVLLDFGSSLWGGETLRYELPGLASTGFAPGGQFGIGFYSVFMLGDRVRVTSRRYERSGADEEDQYELMFEEGLRSRPVLLASKERCFPQNHGTRVSVEISDDDLPRLFASSRFNKVQKELDYASLWPRLVASLCPASNVQVRAVFDNLKPVICVSPGDWAHIPDDEILTRTMQLADPFVDQSKSVRLAPVYDEAGRLIGRVGVARSHRQSAAITVNGIVGGRMSGVAGIVKADGNNLDLTREDAYASGSLADWERWARALLDMKVSLDKYGMLLLHPLLPDEDFEVWELSDVPYSLSSLKSILAQESEVLVHDGPINHDDDDDVSSSRFDAWFEIASNVLCIPESDNYYTETRFPFSLGIEVGLIDYAELLTVALGQVWGGFTVSENMYVVGEVDGYEIQRECRLYKRV